MTLKSALLPALVLTLLCYGQPAARAAGYETAPVTVTTAGTTTTVSGTVIPFKEVTLAAQTSGQIKKMVGSEGDLVRAGQLLVSVTDDALQAQRKAAVAQMYAAEAELRNAHVQYSREFWSPKTGRESGMGMPSMMDKFMRPMFSGQYAGPNNPWVRRYADLHGQAQGLDSARSRLAQARAMIEQLDAQIRDAHLRAPFDGVITKKFAEEGDSVQPGQPLLHVAYVFYLRVQAEVPVGLASSLKRFSMVPVRIDVGNGINVKAKVIQIFPVADRQRHTVTVKFDLESGIYDPLTGATPSPGAYAEVEIPDPRSQAIKLVTIPLNAIVSGMSLQAVEVDINGKPVLRSVRLGGPVGKDRVAVLSGLTGSETVVLQTPARIAMRQAGN